MCKVISIVNQKGGCSKTTSAVNIGIGLANAGKKVVLIDADAQGSLTASLGFQKPDELKVTLATIMAKTINEEEIDLSNVILHHEEGVDLVPGNIELSGLEVQLSNVLSRELILKEFVDSLRDSYENSKIVPLEESSVNTSAEHVKELEDELLKLRIENALLKELRRLRLEDEAKMRERQESSTVSEDSSN